MESAFGAAQFGWEVKFSVKKRFRTGAISRRIGVVTRFQSDQDNGRVRFRAQRAGQMLADQTGWKRVGEIRQRDDLRKQRFGSGLRQEDGLFIYSG